MSFFGFFTPISVTLVSRLTVGLAARRRAERSSKMLSGALPSGVLSATTFSSGFFVWCRCLGRCLFAIGRRSSRSVGRRPLTIGRADLDLGCLVSAVFSVELG